MGSWMQLKLLRYFGTLLLLLAEVQASAAQPILGQIQGVKTASDGALVVAGWACQQGLQESIGVQLYVGGLYHMGGVSVTGAQANLPSDQATDIRCGTTGIPHGFQIRLTHDLQIAHVGKTINVYGIHNPAPGNMQLPPVDVFRVPRNNFGVAYFPFSYPHASGCFGNTSDARPWEQLRTEIAADIGLLKSMGVSTIKWTITPGVGNGWPAGWGESSATIRTYCNHLLDEFALLHANGMKVIVSPNNFYIANPFDPNARWFNHYPTWSQVLEADTEAYCIRPDATPQGYRDLLLASFFLSPPVTDGASCNDRRIAQIKADPSFQQNGHGYPYNRLFEADVTIYCQRNPVPSPEEYRQYVATTYGVADKWSSSCTDKKFLEIEYDPAFEDGPTTRRNAWRFFLQESRNWVGTIVSMIQQSPYKDDVVYFDIYTEYMENHYWCETTGFPCEAEGYNLTDTYLAFMYSFLSGLDGSADSPRIPASKLGMSVIATENIDGKPNLSRVDSALNAAPGHFGYFDLHNYPESMYAHLPGPLRISLDDMYRLVQNRSPGTTVIIGEMGRETSPNGRWGTNTFDRYWSEQKQEAMLMNTLRHGQTATPGLPLFLNWTLWDADASATGFGLAHDPHSPKNALPAIAALGNSVPNGDAELVAGTAPAGWTASGYVPVVFGSRLSTQAQPAATHAHFARAEPAAPCDATCWIWVQTPTFAAEGAQRLYVNAFVRSNMAEVRLIIAQYDATGKRLEDIVSPTFAPGASWNNVLLRLGEQNPLLGTADGTYTWFGTTDRATRFTALLIAGRGKPGGPATFLDVDTVTAAVVPATTLP